MAEPHRTEPVPILGGTGALGYGLAVRWALAGLGVVIGSREGERAAEAAEKVRAAVPDAEVEGLVNEEAAGRGPIVFLTVPFRNQSETLNNLRGSLTAGQILVDCTVPLAAAVSGKATRSLGVWQGSAAQQAQEMVPEGVTVVSALHTVGAPTLADLAATLDEDVLVCGDKKRDKAPVAKLIERIEGLRAVNAGPLETARIAEQLTPLLISINVRYKVHAGLKLTGLPDGDPLGVNLKVVVLAGGTGGAKLAAGMQEIAGADLTVIANTGDDVETLGVHVSPDPDLCTYWLTGEIDAERGWGLSGDSFRVFERLKQLGAPRWFGLSDLDLATCLERRRRLDLGERPTVVQRELSAALGAVATVLPMCDEPVRTRVRTPDGWRGFQEYLVHDEAKPAIEEVSFEGIEAATVSTEVRKALSEADVVIIGPSNPVVSIGPILLVPGMRELLVGSAAPLVAVSPFVGGEVIKGPTGKFINAIGHEASVSGLLATYDGLLDGMVVDADDPNPAPGGIDAARLPTLMDSDERRAEVARGVHDYAASLRG